MSPVARSRPRDRGRTPYRSFIAGLRSLLLPLHVGTFPAELAEEPASDPTEVADRAAAEAGDVLDSGSLGEVTTGAFFVGEDGLSD